MGTFSACRTFARTATWLGTKNKAWECKTVPWPPLSPRDVVTLFSKVWRKSFSATTLEPNIQTQRKHSYAENYSTVFLILWVIDFQVFNSKKRSERGGVGKKKQETGHTGKRG